MRVRKQLLGWPVSSIFFSLQGVMIVIVLIFFSQQIQKEKTINITEITKQQWLSTPLKERQDWLNRSKQKFKINFHGNIEKLSAYLHEHGYNKRKPQAWHDIWQALRNDKNSTAVAIIPTTNDGKIESIIFSREMGDSLLALHLWQQPLKIATSEQAIYSGYVSRHKITEKWGLAFWKSRTDETAEDDFMQIIDNSDKISTKRVKQQIFLGMPP